MKPIAIVIICVIVSVTLTSCSKETPTQTTTPTTTVDYFPLKVGNWWKYDNGTVTATIDSLVTLGDNTKAYLMNYTYSSKGSEFLYKKDSTQIAEYKYTGEIDRILLKLPIQIGQKWQYDFGTSEVDSIFVIGKENVTVPAGTFNDCLRLEIYNYSNTVKKLDEIYLLAPNIGPVMWVFDGSADSLVLSSRYIQ